MIKDRLKELLKLINHEVFINTEARHFMNGSLGTFRINEDGLPIIELLWSKPSIRLTPTDPEEADRIKNPSMYKISSQGTLQDLISSSINPRFEILTAAHEYGHYLSHKRGQRTPEYLSALKNFDFGVPLSKKEKSIIYEEESRAWSYGFSALRNTGFQKNKLFRRIKKKALKIYRIRLNRY